MWKEPALAYFKVLTRLLHDGTEETHEEERVKIVGDPIENRTSRLPNTVQKRYRLSQFAGSVRIRYCIRGSSDVISSYSKARMSNYFYSWPDGALL
jgi:hypothetical protein